MEQQVPLVQAATGIQEQPKQQRSPRKKKNSEWTLNQRQFDHSKTQEISHILPGEQLNVFNGEESVSYLQLPVKKKEENCFLYQMWRNGSRTDVIVKSTHGANFASRIHTPRKLVASMKNL